MPWSAGRSSANILAVATHGNSSFAVQGDGRSEQRNQGFGKRGGCWSQHNKAGPGCEPLLQLVYEGNRQMLTAEAKRKCLPQIKNPLNKLRHLVGLGMISLFSDEKDFYQDQLHNTQNSCRFAYNLCDVPHTMKTKFFQTIILGCVFSEDDVILPHIFDQGLRFNLDSYVRPLNLS